jgi:hypothetical protein
MVQALAVVAVGLAIVYGGAVELLAYIRARHRLERTSAVVVGLVNVGLFRANSKSYAARFRFTTREGRVVEAVSSLSTFPGPRIGKQFIVVYDPADPEGSAERVGTRKAQITLAPLLVAGGAAFAAWGVSLL